MTGRKPRLWTRRAAIGALGAGAMTGLARGQAANPGASVVGDIMPMDGPTPLPLPLRATRLEHIGTVVPDVAAAIRFHSKLFNPNIRKEEAGPLRAYVDLSGPDGSWGYLAFGDRGEERAFFDHFCATIADYNPDAMARTLRGRGVDPGDGWATFGQFRDPDGTGVQIIADPGGWFPTVIDADPMVEGPAILTPMGLGHVSLQVADMDASLDFYRTYFGPEAGSNAAGQVWFALGGANLVLTPAAGETGIDHIGIRAAAFDLDAAGAALADMGAQTVDVVDGQFGPILRFTDPQGLVIELELS